ncbi:MAG: adenylate/guanylate cyclase domain-containing protein [Lachnospiraceae bacterium]|nr:adenylate/guanylate cyclase domain-containing protein [Lachnospiraceae bacterium]
MNNKNNKVSYKKYILVPAVAIVITALAMLGAFRRLDRWAQDKLLQKPQLVSDQIVVIGMDEKALTTLGAYNNWGRGVMTQVLEQLTSDPESMPAVVAIDTLYSGETNKEDDEKLAAAAAKLPHIVVGDVATFGNTKNLDEQGSLQIVKNSIVEFEEPYDGLKAVTTQGHINAMYDVDGIMRHAMLYIEPDDRKIYSMAFEVSKAYLESKGEEITEPVTDSNGFFYLPYSVLPGGFYDSVSIVDVMNGDVPKDYYAGKIVFIGPYAVGLQDAYYTSISRAEQMYGVEIQANVVEAMINGNYKTEANDVAQAIALFIVCMVAGYFIVYKTKLVGASIISACVTAATIATVYIAYNSDYVLHVVWIPIGILVLYLSSIIMRYVAAALERARVTHTFERYVAPEIVGELLKEGSDALELGGKMYDIAVLFVDVRGFTTMSEALDPPTVVEIINRYLTLTTECIMRYNGTLDKFVGDCTMAFWNAPLPQEDPVYLACKAAMDMVEGSKKLAVELEERFGRSVAFGIGVNYGPAVVGNIGAPQRMDYTAIGDTVNTSARLEANAPGGKIYISRSVADALGDRAKTTSLGGTIKLKGKAEGFEILTLDELE